MGAGERRDMQKPGGVRRRILVLLAYEGAGPPGDAVLDKRAKLHALLRHDEVCAVYYGPASHGLAELVVLTTDVDKAKANIWHYVNALGLALRATVYVGRVRCGRCHGTGAEPCRACDETGIIGRHGGTCGVCGGMGAVRLSCAECRGLRVVPEQ